MSSQYAARRTHRKKEQKEGHSNSHLDGERPSKPRRPSRERTRESHRGRDKKREREKKEREERESSLKEKIHSMDRPEGSKKGKEKAKETFEMGNDFIGFAPSSEDEDEERAPPGVRERDWDKGKRRVSERDRELENGAKRKHERIYDEDGQRRATAFRRAPWVADVDWQRCKNVSEMLHLEVEAFVNYVSPTPIEHEVRSLVVDLISKAVREAFPDARVLPFGSFGTKLYLPLGDIDLVIESDSMAYSDKVNVLHALANTLKRSKITNKVTIIAKAKVPIVKFVTTHGRLNVDISVNQGNGVVAAEIVKGFLKDMHGGGMALKSLVMITKAFLSQRSMNEVYTGGLGSYSIVCLAVSFLQMHPKIRRGEIDAARNLGVLVMEFFELYGCYFNYEEVGISVRNGGSYYSKHSRGWHDYYKRNLLSIEDPTDPSNDVSKGSYAIQKVRTTFAGAYGILSAAAYIRAGMISSQHNGRYLDLSHLYDTEDASMLASILGITQETVNHRRLIQEVYDDRVLHRLLGVEPLRMTREPEQPDSRRARAGSSATTKAHHRTSTRSAQAVEEDYEEADMDLSSDDEEHHRHSPYNKRRERSEEEEGRYGIGARDQPLNKRRKIGTQVDMHTVYTTDDDEDDEVVAASAINDEEVSLEEGEYVPGAEEDGTDIKSSEQDKRRAYWLSKGIGPGSVDDD